MRTRKCFLLLVVIAALVPLASVPAAAGVISPELRATLRSLGREAEVPIIVRLSDRPDVRRVRGKSKRARRSRLLRVLRRNASRSQHRLRAILKRRRVRDVVPLWITNGVAIRAGRSLIHALARLPGVERIGLDATLGVPEVTGGTPAVAEWNIEAIGAPNLWARGSTGAGMVVANMDTGVDIDHPDLRDRWRGGQGGWFDPAGEHGTPHDSDGHGTWTMGLMVGGSAGGTAIGVAPAARWIAVKIFDDAGVTSLSRIHQGFQWLLDPDGDPNTDDAPDVVSNSWGFQNDVGGCNGEFERDIAALRTAGIPVVFSAGNAGPAQSTSMSPANNTGSLAVGAIGASLDVAAFSSRGPSACDAGIYPKIVAPGVNVKTSDLTFGGAFPESYVHVSGTSFAAPHVAAGMALLWSAFPAAALSDVEAAIAAAALDLGAAGPDNSYGYGLLDLAAARDWLEAASGVSLYVRVAAGSDDAEERRSGKVKLHSSDLELVYDKSEQTVGMRFAGVNVPPGASITDAYLQFQVDEKSSLPTTLTIEGQDIDEAPSFTSQRRNVSARSRTTASVSWLPPPWSSVGDATVQQRSPNLAPVIQEVVDRPGWARGNAVVLLVTGSGKRVAESYDGDPAAAPVLRVKYSTGVTTSASTSTTTTSSTTTTLVSVTTTTAGQSTTTSSTTTTTTTGGTSTSTTTGLPPVAVTLEVRVRDSSDDAEERTSGSVKLDSSDLELVYDKSDQTVGIRFTGVTVPNGAAILDAYVQFQVDEKTSATTTLRVAGEAAADPAAFTRSLGDITSRPRTTAFVPWTPAPWRSVGEAGLDQRTPNIAPVIQQIVGDPVWRSGDALVIIIDGTGERVAESYDGEPSGAPLLHIEYGVAGAGSTTTTPPTSTTSTLVSTTTTTSSSVTTTSLPSGATAIDVRVAASSDDAEERSSGRVKLTSSDLELVYDKGNQTVGMRFAGLAIPRGATIRDAYVQLQADETGAAPTLLTIAGEANGDSLPFAEVTGQISSRPKTTVSVSWSPPPWPAVGDAGPDQRTPNLATVLQAIIDRPGWLRGNAVVIIVTGTGERVAESYDGDKAAAPLLHVEYEAQAGGG